MADSNQVYVCGFYSNRFQYVFSAKRLKRQLKKLEAPFYICFYSEKKLFQLLEKRHQHLLRIFQTEKKSKGFAHWAWKPLIINETLRSIPEESMLLYIDIGCDLISNIAYWETLIEKVKNSNMITCNSRGHGIRVFGDSERSWTKWDVLKALDIAPNDQMSPQIQSTWIMLINNYKNQEFIQNWIDYCTMDNLSLVKPNTSIQDKNKWLIEHRNDQSIFSCLIKKSKLNFQLADEFDMSIIRASRNLSYFTFGRTNIYFRVVKYLEKKLIELLNVSLR
jgi:hypothetical protein